MINALSGLFGTFSAAGEALVSLVEAIGKRSDLSQEQKDAKIEVLEELYKQLEAQSEIEIARYEARNPEGFRYWELAGEAD